MTFRSTAVLSAALVVGGCTRSIAQLEPTRLQSARPGTEVVQLAVRELTGLGFEIVAADAASGVVTARRIGRQRDLAGLIRCVHRHDGAELTISVSARPAAAGSEVLMSSRVTDRHTPVGAPASEDHDACASSGEVERRIAEAVRTSR